MGIFDQAGGSPGFSFDHPGDMVQGLVVGTPQVKPQMVFDNTGKPTDVPDKWRDGSDKMKVVITLQTDLRDPQLEDDDGTRSIYAVMSNSKGSLFRTIREAIQAAGRRDIEEGAMLQVWYIGPDPTSTTIVPRKLYGAQYRPPASPLAGPPQQQPPQQAPQAYQPPAQVDPYAGAPAWAQPQQAPVQQFQQQPPVQQYQPSTAPAPQFQPPQYQEPVPSQHGFQPGGGIDFAAMAAQMAGQQAPSAQQPPAAYQPPAQQAPAPQQAPGLDPALVAKLQALIGAGLDDALISQATGMSVQEIAAFRGGH